jgi:hypothetical protein
LETSDTVQNPHNGKIPGLLGFPKTQQRKCLGKKKKATSSLNRAQTIGFNHDRVQEVINQKGQSNFDTKRLETQGMYNPKASTKRIANPVAKRRSINRT